MTFKKKTLETEAVSMEQPAWRYEDGVTATSSPEIRAMWMVEYKRRQKEVLPKHDKQSALFAADNQ